MSGTTKRRRRTPEEARKEILDAAEHILLTTGPSDLKFQTIADHAGLAASNVHHHFGGVLEIKRALTERALHALSVDLATALAEDPADQLETYAEQVLVKFYHVLASERYAKLIGWIVLSTEVEAQRDFVSPLPIIRQAIAAKLQAYIPAAEAKRLAREVIHNVAISAIGQGLIGDALNSSIGTPRSRISGEEWLRAYWRQQVSDALAKAPTRESRRME